MILQMSPLHLGTLLRQDLQITHVCNVCSTSTSRTEKELILTVPVAPTVGQAISLHTADEILTGANRRKCEKCGSLQETTRETRITHAPVSLIVQMQRFPNDANGIITRDFSVVKVFPDILHVKAIADGLVVNHAYNLRATVNHRGTLSSGHYWSHVALTKSTWLKCDDIHVGEMKRRSLNNDSSYLFFFSR